MGVSTVKICVRGSDEFSCRARLKTVRQHDCEVKPAGTADASLKFSRQYLRLSATVAESPPDFLLAKLS